MSKNDKFPVLPDGYFWRVGPREARRIGYLDYYPCFGVSLRRKTWYGSKRAWFSSFGYGEYVSTSESDLIADAYRLKQRFDDHNRFNSDLARLSGDYPPKELK